MNLAILNLSSDVALTVLGAVFVAVFTGLLTAVTTNRRLDRRREALSLAGRWRDHLYAPLPYSEEHEEASSALGNGLAQAQGRFLEASCEYVGSQFREADHSGTLE